MKDKKVAGEEAQRFAREYRETGYERNDMLVKFLKIELDQTAKDLKIEVLQIGGRPKEVDKVVEKVIRKNYTDPRSQMRDLAGVRVITIFESDIERLVEGVREAYKRTFEFSPEDSGLRRDEMATDQFGYQSHHLVFKIVGRQPPWSRFNGMWVELQLRSTLQSGWADVSHRIDYKSGVAPPPQITRRLNAVSALLEIADERFDDLRREIQLLREEYEGKLSAGDYDVELDALSLRLVIDNLERFKLVSWSLNELQAIGTDAGMAPWQFDRLDARSIGRLTVTLRALDIVKVEHLIAVIADIKDSAESQLLLFMRQVKKVDGVFYADGVDILNVLVSMKSAGRRLGRGLPKNFDWSGESLTRPTDKILQALREVSGLC